MKSVRIAAIAAAAGLVLAGCGTGDAESTGSGDKLKVVTSTNVYADLASQVAGDAADVEPIISDASKDPHDYEATSNDQLKLSKADVVIVNGGGYDAFMTTLLEAADKDPKVVNGVEVSELPGAEENSANEPHDHDHGEEGHDHDHGHDHGEEGHDHDHGDHDHGHEGHSHDHGGKNEHVWYDLDHMEEFVGDLGKELAKADSDNAKTYEANAGKLAEEIAGLTDSDEFKSAKKALDGKSFMMTEPVPEALLKELGMKDATPEGLSSAVEAGQEIPALVIKRAEDSLKQGKVQLFAFNSQTADPQTKKLYETAKKAGVPTVDVTETIPEGKTFVEWMQDNIAAIAKAVDAK